MKDTYTLIDVLLFLKGQKELDFQGIKVILEIFEGNKVSDERKRWIIISGLRGLGLREIEAPEAQVESEEVKIDMPDEITFNKPQEVGYAVEFYEVELINSFVTFEVFLN